MAFDCLIDVAVPLPVHGTFTYGCSAPMPTLGAQVLVPFGRRRVTGFVLGPAAVAGTPPAGLRGVERIVSSEPAFDEEMLALCRWAAAYYSAPLGEVLRTALPQGERARAVRSVEVTELGRREAEAPRRLIPDDSDALLARLLAAGGRMTLRSIQQAGAERALRRLVSDGWVTVVDTMSERRPDRMLRFAVAVAVAVPPLRAPARARLLSRLLEVGAAGIAVPELSAPERVHLRGLLEAGLARVEERPAAAAASGTSAARTVPVLNADQVTAVEALGAALGAFSTFLLHGVTGSGKTEVYLRAIAAARAAGRGALVLVPEIALTPQLASWFRSRFGDDVAVLHSALPPAERLLAWRRLRSGEVGIAVGARSAVFAPVPALGIVVVDEEHDPSFKQEDGFRYNARDLAVVRAQKAGAVAVLGSATPSLESYHNATQGKFKLLSLPRRATPRPLPAVEIVDLRRDPPGPDGLLSSTLAEAVAANLAQGEQTILFLNRRGFSTFILCRGCGHVVRCADCAVSMTHHQRPDRLVCHYCARTQPVPARCPACGADRLERLGTGTERVEAMVRMRFPDARVARLDRDTADVAARDGSGRRGFEAVLAGVQSGEVDILIGTQMVSKGHDFPGVTLVGVLQPDTAIHLPDFRAAERTFQLLEQVAGRAGRGVRPGRVIIQTYVPDHAALLAVRAHDYGAFVEQELRDRRDLGYPPFAHVTVLRLDGPEATRVRQDAVAIVARLRAGGGLPVRVRGPAEAPIARLRGRCRYQVWLSGPDRAPLAAAARLALDAPLGNDVRLSVDVDPQSVL